MSYLREKWKALVAWADNSETILIARAQKYLGLLVAGFGAVDYQMLLTSNDTPKKTIIAIGIVMFVKGILDEIARRTRDREMQ